MCCIRCGQRSHRRSLMFSSVLMSAGLFGSRLKRRRNQICCSIRRCCTVFGNLGRRSVSNCIFKTSVFSENDRKAVRSEDKLCPCTAVHRNPLTTLTARAEVHRHRIHFQTCPQSASVLRHRTPMCTLYVLCEKAKE